MLNTLFFHPLGPALILALGGLLLQLGTRWGNGRYSSRPARAHARPLPLPLSARTSWIDRLQSAVTPSALVCLSAAGIDLMLLRRPPAWLAHVPAAGLLHWGWQPLTVAGSELNWQMNGWNALVAILLLLLIAAALVLESASSAPAPAQRTSHMLWLGAAALAFVFSGNVVTLASCWVLLDLALTLRLGSERHEAAAGRAWSLLSLAGLLPLGILLLLGEGGIRAELVRGPFDRPELGLLWFAALIRAGVYPFHLWVTTHDTLDAGDDVAVHLIVPLTGLWLLTRVHALAGPGWLRRPEWAALGGLALLGSALAAWAAEDEALAWRWVAVNRASLVVMAAYMTDLTGPPALAWALISFSLGLTLLLAGRTARDRWGWSWPGVLGALAIWGLPGTPGFLARSALVLPVQIPGALLLFCIVAVAEILLVATLWRVASGDLSFAPATAGPSAATVETGRPAAPAAGATSGLWSMAGLGALVILLAVSTLAWGVAPRQLGPALSEPATGLAALPITQIMLEARRSVWGLLLVSGVAGAGLGLLRRQIFAGMRGWQRGITTLVGLEWLYQGIAYGFGLAGIGLRYFATLGEGEGYLGWLLLGGLILWYLLRG